MARAKITPQLRYYKWVIAVAQNAKQLQGIQDIITQKRIDYHGVFPPEARSRELQEFIRQLEIQEAMGLEVQNDLLEMRDTGKVAKRAWWDIIVLRAYEWSQV